MYEFTQALEQLFQADIKFIQTTTNPNIAPAQFQLGTLYTHMGMPEVVVRMNVVFRLLVRPRAASDMMNIFRSVTSHAIVTSIQHEIMMDSPFPVHMVEFRIFDLEEFNKDMQKIVWDEFDQRFNEQLDSVLEKE